MPAMRIVADASGRLNVPDEPIIPVVAGDGVGPELWRAVRPALERAVAKAFGGKRKLHFQEHVAGARAQREKGEAAPSSTVNAFRLYRVGLVGPQVPTSFEAGPSLAGELGEILDLFVNARPVRIASKTGAGVDVVVVREEREDGAGSIEFRAGSMPATRTLTLLHEEAREQAAALRFGTAAKTNAYRASIERLPNGIVETGLSARAASRLGTERLVRAALALAESWGRTELTIVHEADSLPMVEGAFLQLTREVLAKAAEPLAPPAEIDGFPAPPRPARPALPTLSEARLATLAGRLMSGRDARGIHVALHATATQLLALLTALGADAWSSAEARLNPETGHGLFGPCHEATLPEGASPHANPVGFFRAAALLLTHLGWREAAGLVTPDLAARLQAGGRSELREVSTRDFGLAVLEALA
jgi:isocitrate dehydrogenase